MRIRAHILPPDVLRKGEFAIEVGDRIADLVASLRAWIEENKGLIPVLRAVHDDKTPAVGRVVDAHGDANGIYVDAEIDHPLVAEEIAAGGWKRVSARLIKNLADRTGNKVPLRIGHLALVHEPQYHDQDPIAIMDFTSGDDGLCIFHTEGDLSSAAEAGEEMEEKEEKTSAETVEAVSAEDVEALRSELADLRARVMVLEEAMAPEEDMESEEESEDLSATVTVLRDTRARDISGWTETELIELATGAPSAYAKVIASLPALGADLSAPTPPAEAPATAEAPAPKVLGGSTEAANLSAEEAFEKARAEFEAGGDFLKAYHRLTGGQA